MRHVRNTPSSHNTEISNVISRTFKL